MIRIENMSKYYGERLAVDNVSFNVARGEVVGFLGPNGAGKTTTMRAITGYLMPSEGQVWVGEHNMRQNSLKGRQHIGYLPETIPLYGDMTTRAYLGFAARLRGLDRQTTKRRIDEVVDICHLEEYIDVITGKLSKGFRQRVGLAQAIIHDPEVLILDEPTVGIDPLQVVQTKELIKTLGQRRTILLSTHILPEVSLICERVIIIHEGRIVAEDSIENLSSILKGEQRLRLKVQGPVESVCDRLARIDSVLEVDYEEPYYLVDFSTDQEPQAEISEALAREGWTLLAMETMEMSLEEIFVKLTGEKENEAHAS